MDETDPHTRPRAPSPLESIDAQVEAYCGTQSLPDRGWRLQTRAEERMSVLGVGSLGDYSGLLSDPSRGADEVAALAESLRVGETGWFRHPRQLGDVGANVLCRLHRSWPDTSLRVWCAGCGTGEEAYSVAATLANARPPGMPLPSVLGTDISRDAIALAQRAVWPTEGKERIPEEIFSRFFRAEGRGMGAKPALRKVCRFRTHNLMSGSYPGTFHLVFCRNVLIYFSERARRAVLSKLVESLIPGGYLVLGYSESLGIVKDYLEPHRLGSSLFWTRRQASAGQSRPEARHRATGSYGHAKKAYEGKMGRSLRPVGGAAHRPAKDYTAHRGIRQNCSFLGLTGAYSPDRVQKLRSELRSLLSTAPKVVVLDLGRVEYLCEEAAVPLRRAAAQHLANGGRFVLVAGRPGVRRWADRAGLDAWMEVVDEPDRTLRNAMAAGENES